jgi:integrase
MENIIEEKQIRKKPERLSLTKVSEGLRVGIKSDGKKYTVRDDRSAYFFPERWIKFFETIKEEKRPIFDALISTGGRIEEILNIKPEDFDWERNNLILKVTKTKATKGETVGRKRTFSISSQFARRMRKYINDNHILTGQVLFPVSKQAVSQLFKRGLVKAEFKDWQQFSLHNIRKTHGNWLKALEISSDEICLRLGHDHNTYLRHYGSASIFDRKDKLLMIKILGDVYGLK